MTIFISGTLTRGRSRSGVALVIVLAFVVLLTGLIIAFFSRSILDRQISNSSASRAKVSDFADGAAETIISDLRQEIVLSSTAYPLNPATSGTLYVPLPEPVMASGTALSGTIPVGLSMLPQLSGVPSSTGTAAPNLLVVSSSGQVFYSGTNAAGQTVTVAENATAVSSTTPSLNGRYFTTARWNEHYLLPINTTTDATPGNGGGWTFTPPNWVLVARSGSNPNPPTLITTGTGSMLSSGANPNSVIGRYAYAIYHEGGLLDVNAAGYPSSSGTFSVYKDGLAYADLSQVFAVPAAGIPAATATNCIDQLVAWRNYASIPSPGPFLSPGFSTSSTTATGYNNYVLSNTTGYLSISGTAVNNQTDRMFSSRQELIRFAQNVWGFAPGNVTNKYFNVLNYLATFTRDLNQPSYIPVQSVDQNSPGYNAKAPQILTSGSGGNSAAPDIQTPSGTHLDNLINCAFPTVRVPSPGGWPRNDGSLAQTGEPLVKKRFALNRLAWLTYVGPISSGATLNPTGDPNVQQIISTLENTYGFTDAFLKQGTAANIQNYFGLTWTGTGAWIYVHNGANNNPSISGSGAIMRVGRPLSVTTPDPTHYVQDESPGREPDFFELLKAGITAGSLGKASTLPQSIVGTYTFQNFYNQYYTDNSIDCHIIQIGANIIDQFKMDNFPTHIVFNDSTGPRDFYGVENLPYLYRLHPAVVKAIAPIVQEAGSQLNFQATGPNAYLKSDAVGTLDYLATSGTIQNTGLGVTMLIPEVWNPHDWDATSPSGLNRTLGLNGAGPTAFRIYAAAPSNPVVLFATNGNNSNQQADPTLFNEGSSTLSPGYTTRGFSWTGNSVSLTQASTYMTFTIPNSASSNAATGAQLFREPTVLFAPGTPTGTNLAAPGLGTTAIGGLLSNGGVRAAIGDLAISATSGAMISGSTYIGFYLGTLPLVWQVTGGDTHIYYNRWVALDKNVAKHGVDVTVYIQYQDPSGNWRTYDQKEFTLGHEGIGYGKIAAPMHHYWAGFLDPYTEGDREYFVLDPRTSRFGVQTSSIPQVPGYKGDTTPYFTWNFPPFTSDPALFPLSDGYQRWISQAQGIMSSLRDGWGIGGSVQAVNNTPGDPYDLVPYNFASAMGFYPGNNGGANSPYWTWSYAQYAMRYGLLSQNSPYTLWADRLNGDAQWIGNGAGTYGQTTPQYYADADGVVRRAMGGWADVPTAGVQRPESTYSGNYATLMGLPMRVAHYFSPTDNMLHKADVFAFNEIVPPPSIPSPPSTPTSANPLLQAESRSMIIHRPFRSVAELGYTFSGTPWKDLDFTSPESGDAALLDVFCINDTADPNGLAAGKVNLNTQQQPVLQGILAEAYKDEMNAVATQISAPPTVSSALALSTTLAVALVQRTSGIVSGSGARPLQNIADLVGRWNSAVAAGAGNTQTSSNNPQPPTQYFDATSYDGFTADLFNPAYFLNPLNKTPNSLPNDTDVNAAADAVVYDKTIMRRRAAPIRALANAGQTRVWNLLIDLVAQTGRYTQSSTGASNPLAAFVVDGERHYWVHVAIDRLTGQVIDKQVEVVEE